VRRTGVKRQNEGRRHVCSTVVLLLFGALFMNPSQADGGRPAEALRGPDFVLEKVASWVERPGADAELTLRDGSVWRLKRGAKLYEDSRDVIGRAQRRDRELFLSGDKSRGLVEIIMDARNLAVQEMSSKEENGRYAVLFQGPPSVYHLYTDRPWFAQALSLLQKSANGGGSFSSPDLLVVTDPRGSEIVAVRALNNRKPGATR
jgi:hypothetical protein